MRKHGAFILARYSTDRQNPDSIEVQVEKCSCWCSENNMPILGVFADMAVSGMKDTRPQYALMMTQLRTEMADTVVIYDQSRMFRKMTAWFAFRDELSAMGVTVISVTQPQIGKDLRDPANFVAEGSFALFNQMHSLITRQKVIEKMRYMAKTGQHTGGTPPLGYCVKDGRLEIDEKEAALVQRIFREYASGRTYREIIAGLNSDGLTTKKGNAFGTNSLHDLLKNKKYIGILVYGKAPRTTSGSRNTHAEAPEDIIEIHDAIPAIITPDVWEIVQKKMAKNKRASAGRPSTVREYPLKGKVFCGECGSALVYTGSKNSSGRYHYYTCSGKQRRGNCRLNPIKMELLESTVADIVRSVLSDPQKRSALLKIMHDEKARLQSGCIAQLNSLLENRSELVQQLDRATDAILNGLSSKNLLEKIPILENKLELIDQNISLLKKSVDSVSVSDTILDHSLDDVLKNDLSVLSIVLRVEVSNSEITVWTLLDPDPNNPTDRFTHKMPDSDFIDIPGAGSPAPRIFINADMLMMKIRR